METVRLFTQRKRAKDAALGLLRINGEGDVDVKVYITSDREYYIFVDHPDEVEDLVAGIMGLGQPDYLGVDLDADDCVEFYQGPGLSRFRGV